MPHRRLLSRLDRQPSLALSHRGRRDNEKTDLHLGAKIVEDKIFWSYLKGARGTLFTEIPKASFSLISAAKILNLCLLPQPRIAHRYAKPWVNLHDEESDALIGLVRICEERGGDSLAYSKATRICPA
ncbi:MAG: hypothetical protein JWQ50_5914 [Caballeronia mineralivorans]|jgi:hypothetical protein|nr:hypothetical protein [Caballeronia mineralivorans]MEA3098547.1 hypothetical protein [Caballeronia mineralivorans]